MNIGVEHGVLMILETWGGIWGVNGFKTWGGIWGTNDFKNMGRRDFLKHGAKYGVPIILKTWGEIWGVNIKKFLIIFLVFHQNDVYEL